MIAVRSFLIVLVIVLVAAWSAALLRDDPEHAQPPKALPPVSADTPGPPLAATADPDATGELITIAHYLDLMEAERLEAQRLAEEAAAQRAADLRRGVPRAATVPTGDCADIEWEIPVELVQRESGCNFDAQSPASFCGGVGCVGAYQFRSVYFDPGGICGDLDWHVPEHQHECARRLLANGGLAHWGA